MSLTVLRYREAPINPGDVVQVNTPQAAISQLRDWQRRFPNDRGMVLDEWQQPIATSQPRAAKRN